MRTPEQVVSLVRDAVAQGSRGKKSAFIILEDLESVEGSVTKCLTELVRVAADAGAHLVLADPSGLARAFLEGIGGAEPFVSLEGNRRIG